MAVQYIVVKFTGERGVLIDNGLNGKTNETLRVGEGVHTIKLDGKQNYTPAWRRPDVTDTSPIMPMEVTFELSE